MMLRKILIWTAIALVLIFAFFCSGKKQEGGENPAVFNTAAAASGQDNAGAGRTQLSESGRDEGDWKDAFAFVRDSIRTEASRFPLKTAEGVRWGRNGNSLEKALLLAQILQDGGHTIRIAEGDLDDPAAKSLLAKIFPATKTFSYSDDVPISVPAEDAGLIAAVRRHFWVQMEDSDGWVDLDPSFPAAEPGRSFTSVKESHDPSDESLKTWAWVSLESTAGDSGEPESVFSWDGPMEEVAKQPLSLAIVAEFQGVSSGEEEEEEEEEEEGGAAGGLFGALGGRTSQPKKDKAEEKVLYNAALTIGGEEAAEGRFSAEKEPISRLVLKLRFESLGEIVSQSERILFEKAGKESEPPLFQRHAILIAGNRIPPEAWQDKLNNVSDSDLLNDVKSGIEEIKRTLKSKKFDRNTLGKSAELEEKLGPDLGHLINMIFASTSDDQTEKEAEALSVYAYYQVPRILITSFTGDQERTEVSFDLRQDRVEAVPYPGQALAMSGTFLYGRGVMESTLEGKLLDLLAGQPALTTAVLMREAERINIPIRMFSSLEKESLRGLGLPEPVAEKIGLILDSGRIAVLPEKGVPWQGQERWGWWDIDPATMETVGVMDSGLHQAMVQRTILDTKNPLHEKMGFVIGAMTGAVDTQWMLAGMVLKYGELNKAALQEAKSYMKNIRAYMCPKFEKKIEAGVGFTAFEMEDCFKLAYEIKIEAGVKISQGWCENFAKGFACASTTILNYYLSQAED
ncbi:MAG: hypothetical protein JXE07_05250 [Candidatus Aminicenantes bacterium]|nr:hypothetical protein [Candidatus Aminicenantes bacterium]